MRKLIVNDKQYEYRIGKQNTVIRYNGKSVIVDHREMIGIDWNDIERGRWKKWFSIKPKDIVEYIQRIIK